MYPSAAGPVTATPSPGGKGSETGDPPIPGCGDVCTGDVDGDGMVNTTDLLTLLADWGPCPDCASDFDDDDDVDTSDLLTLLAAWGPCL